MEHGGVENKKDGKNKDHESVSKLDSSVNPSLKADKTLSLKEN